MAFAADFAALFGRRSDDLCSALLFKANRLAKIAAGSSRGTAIFDKADKASRIDQLVAADAWTDAAFALIELEMPDWKLRRLVYENGEWLCSLSRRPNLPLALDDSVDTSDEILAVAILRAMIEARPNDNADETRSSIPQVWSADDLAICCDNFI